jgi:eukaryotic-like serine/threonine-protein kinase
LRDIGDARISIDEVLSGAPDPALAAVAQPAQPRLRRMLPWALAGIAILIAAILGYLQLQPKKAEQVVRFSIPLQADLFSGTFGTFDMGRSLTLSADGSKLAVISTNSKVWVRSLDSLAGNVLQETDGATEPFWSPDGRYIAFGKTGKLIKQSVPGGATEAICDWPDPVGGTWGSAGVILFASLGSLYRVPETGGAPALVVAPDQARHELRYDFPQFLPDGRHFLFLGVGGGALNFIGLGSLDSTRTERLMDTTFRGLYAAPGFLLYLNGTTLMARPFDAKALRFTGEAVPVAQNLGWMGVRGYFAVSQTGVLAYQEAPGTSLVSNMVWYNRKGEKLGTVGEAGYYSNPALSPDATQVAVGLGQAPARDIWVYDLRRGTQSRLTFGSSDNNSNPVWSADGRRILYSSTRGGQRDIYELAANGLGKGELIYGSKDQLKAIDDISPDERYALYDTAATAGTEVWILPLAGEKKPFLFVPGARYASFSPDGKYVAYASFETGRYEIYVRTFPEPVGKWQISTSGGVEPTWRRDGKELFYLSPENELVSVEVNADSKAFRAGVPKVLFQSTLISGFPWRNRYVASADGQRFLMLTPPGEAAPSPINIVVNWPALLENR